MSSVALHNSMPSGPQGIVSPDYQEQDQTPETSFISSLPIEILEIAFGQISDYKDRAHFSGVSQLFKTVASSYEQGHQEEYDSAKWKAQEGTAIRTLKGRIAEANQQERETRLVAEAEFRKSQAKVLSLMNARWCVGPFKSMGGLLEAILPDSFSFLARVFPNNYLSEEIRKIHDEWGTAQLEWDAAQKACSFLKLEASLLVCELMRQVEQKGEIPLTNNELDALLIAVEDRKPPNP